MFKPTLLLRADANLQIGWGHVLRSLALAQAWQDAGGTAVFACADLPASLETRLRAQCSHVERVHAAIGSGDDAARTQTIAREHGASWLICDGYNFAGDWLRAVKSDAFSLCALDDLSATDLSAANLILNPNAGATAEFYARFAANATVLVGADYALLRREFRLRNRGEKIINSNIERVLIAMGGADICNLVPRALNWLQAQNFAGEVVVLSGARAFDLPSFSFDLRTVNARDEVPDWMNWCDLTLAAAGATTWELACCGAPAILSVVAENQRPLARWCEQNGVAVSVGEADEDWDLRLENAWYELNYEARRAMSRRARNAVDGQGAARAIQNLWPGVVQLRAVTSNDARILWEWRNEAQTRAMSLQSDFVEWETHRTWLDARLNDGNSLLWIAHRDGESLGTVRFARDEQGALISVVLAPDWRGQRLATPLIQSACRALFALWNVPRIRAQIKPENAASRRAFENAGFNCETEDASMPHLNYFLERPT